MKSGAKKARTGFPESSVLTSIVPATLLTVRAFKATTVAHEHMGYFIASGTAERALEGTGHRPGDGKVEPVDLEVVAYDDPDTKQQVVRLLSKEVVRFSYERPADVRARALSKLTPEELEALGLKR